MCSRSKLPMGHLLQSWVMDQWSPGVMRPVEATAVLYRISCEMYSTSKLLLLHLLQSCVMECWSLGDAKDGGDSSMVQDQL